MRDFRIKLLQLFIFTVFFCSCAASNTRAQSSEETAYTQRFSNPPLIVDVRISRREMTISESLTVTVSAHLPDNYEVIMPEFQAALGDFSIKEQYDAKKELTDTGLLISKTWVVEPFLAGDYSIPRLSITAKDSNNPGKTYLVTTSEVIIPVASFLDSSKEEQELADIIPPLTITRNNTFLYITAGFLVIITGAGIFWFFLRRASGKTNLPMIPCHREALTAIDALAEENLPSKGRHKEFFNRLSLILRFYIESRFALKAPEQTTEEFFAHLQETALFNQDQKNRLHHFLSRSDLIKFAEALPANGEAAQALSLCRDFIEQTSEKPPETDIKSNGGRP